MQPIEPDREVQDLRRIEPYEYPSEDSGAEENQRLGAEEASPEAEPASAPTALSVLEAELHTQYERQLAAERQMALDAGQEQGREEGRRIEREAQQAASRAGEEQRRRQAAELAEEFRQERKRYFERVEHEVVGLALAVAARILRREAQMDPLLLTGAVRVALGQLADSTEVRLKVPAEELGLWHDSIALVPNLTVKPTIVAGEGMRRGDCAIETELGSVDLGVRAQLGEIERGFFDRIPGSKRETARPAEGTEESE